jgi:hypothetical protein
MYMYGTCTCYQTHYSGLIQREGHPGISRKIALYYTNAICMEILLDNNFAKSWCHILYAIFNAG